MLWIFSVKDRAAIIFIILIMCKYVCVSVLGYLCCGKYYLGVSTSFRSYSSQIKDTIIITSLKSTRSGQIAIPYIILSTCQ